MCVKGKKSRMMTSLAGHVHLGSTTEEVDGVICYIVDIMEDRFLMY